MLGQLSVLIHKIGDRTYHLLCDPNSPLNELRESLSEFSKFIDSVEEKAKEKQVEIEEPKEVEHVEC